MTAPASFNPQAFRAALSTFTTGVTIITTRGADGEPVGVTANSFNSVSLNPPLVLWSLAKSALSLPAFSGNKHWNVHVLSADQQLLSGRFASRGEDKFAGVTLDQGINDTPLFKDCTARFQCRTAFTYEGGDHLIFVGEVLAFDKTDLPRWPSRAASTRWPPARRARRCVWAPSRRRNAATPRTSWVT